MLELPPEDLRKGNAEGVQVSGVLRVIGGNVAEYDRLRKCNLSYQWRQSVTPQTLTAELAARAATDFGWHFPLEAHIVRRNIPPPDRDANAAEVSPRPGYNLVANTVSGL